MSDAIRLLVVEDVPQVAQHVRSLLAAQTAIKLIDVVSDGSRVPGLIPELRPDVIVVDALLEGRIRGLPLVTQLRDLATGIPVIVITVPQQPVPTNPALGVHGVLQIPFNGYDLITLVQQVHAASEAAKAKSGTHLVAVFSPKGGTGKTTIAFNLAVAARRLGARTVLVDGSIQFGDLRALLKVPAEAASMLDLPTDRVAEADLQEVLWRDPSGIDILLAPPRIEMAEMVNARDLMKTVAVLRRVYDVIVADLPPVISDPNLAILDAADVVLEVVTWDTTTVHSVGAMAATFAALGYPRDKVRHVVNRADSTGGFDTTLLERAIGGPAEFAIRSGGPLVVEANNDGIPFVVKDPSAGISRDIVAIATAITGRAEQGERA